MDPNKKTEIKTQNRTGKLTIRSYRLYQYQVGEENIISLGYQIPFQAINIKRVKAGKLSKISYKEKTVDAGGSSGHGKKYMTVQLIHDDIIYIYEKEGLSNLTTAKSILKKPEKFLGIKLMRA